MSGRGIGGATGATGSGVAGEAAGACGCTRAADDRGLGSAMPRSIPRSMPSCIGTRIGTRGRVFLVTAIVDVSVRTFAAHPAAWPNFPPAYSPSQAEAFSCQRSPVRM
jgi:hypothetical protein